MNQDVYEASIRPATSRDVPALSELATRTWSEEFGASVDPADAAAEVAATRSAAYFVQALRETTILVAEEEGALAGYVQFGEVDLPEVDVRQGDRALRRIYVDAAAQGRGLGRELMNAALAHPRLAAAQRIFLTVWERNTRAMRLYESLGFEVVGTTSFAIGSEAMEDLVMVLDRGNAGSS